jgi:DNA ligase 1
MRSFALLYDELDQSQATSDKVEAMARWFTTAEPADAAWAVFFLSGNKLPTPLPARELQAMAVAAAGVPEWLFEASYEQVGDRAETIALLLDLRRDAVGGAAANEPWPPTLAEAVAWVRALRGLDREQQRERMFAAWDRLAGRDRFVFHKLITGAFRVGVSQALVVQALAKATGLPVPLLAQRLAGRVVRTPADWTALVAPAGADDADRTDTQPMPFFLASPLPAGVESLGDPVAWAAEWKWDGIRGQLVVRGERALWSRGEERVDAAFPEVLEQAAGLPDGTVLDGEILAFRDGPLPFQALQRRLGRRTVGKTLRTAVPCTFVAYDLLALGGVDQRGEALDVRRARLEALLANTPLRVSERLPFATWEELAAKRNESRARGVEGVMLKRRDSPYRQGRVRGDWWKWKLDPYEFDAALVYAQAGHGRRAGLHTDYTFAVWHDEQLVPIAKAYSGLDREEILELDRWIRANTLAKFGPVRTVPAHHVFTLHCEGIQRSTRHKSGLALRFPRIARWRRDKAPTAVDTLDHVRGLADDRR